MASDGIDFVECDRCGLGHSMRSHESMKPREWADEQGWVTDLGGQDYCPDCRSVEFIGNEQKAPSPSRRLVFGLAGSLVLSVLYDTIPNRWFAEEFAHLRVPRWFRYLFIGAKSSAVAGLLVGLRSPKLGRLTARALTAYFILALGAHRRVGDRPIRYVPAASMLASSALAIRSFPAAPRSAN
jgi:hypothetical protein